MNYTQLKQAIQDYLQNTETSFVGHLDTFIRQAEERINRAVYIDDLRNTATGTTTSGNKYLSKPTDLLAVYSISVTDAGVEYFMLVKDQNFLSEAYPDASVQDLPVYYANFNDDYWIVAPVPDAAYTVTVRYYRDVESIVTAGTSWLGENAESLLLYGCLVEAYTYLKGDADLLAHYQQRYAQAMSDLVQLGIVRAKRDDYRFGQIGTGG